MRTLLRSIKRRLFTGGYSAPVFQFLKELRKEAPTSFHPADGRFLVNISFDLELGFNSPLWERDPKEAILLGNLGKRNMAPTVAFLMKKQIPCNVQIVGGLLDDNFIAQSFLSENQRNHVREHNSLYRLSEDERRALVSENIELGIHGFSHRRFTSLSKEEAEYELERATASVARLSGKQPSFVSFPKNDVAHIELLPLYGLSSWRSNRQDVSFLGEIPLGLWTSPGSIPAGDLSRLLEEIKKLRPEGFFLHLWNHFTEMNSDAWKGVIESIRESGFSFTTVREYLKQK